VAIFENQTGDELLDSYGRLAADWITQSLAQIKEGEAVPVSETLESLRMMGFESGGTQNMAQLRDLAKETEAGTMISGSYSLTENVIRFETRIIDANKGKPIHTLEPVSGPGGSPMEVIEVLRQRIMGTLAIYFSNIPSQARRVLQPPRFESYQEYLLGMDEFGKDYSQALTHFERSVELDPEFPAPRLRMAIIFSHQNEYAKADSMLRSAEQNRDRLSLFEQHLLDGFMAKLQGNYEEGLKFFRQAESLAPEDYLLNYLIGFEVLRLNRPQETVETFAKMVIPEFIHNSELGSWRIIVLAEAFHMRGEYLKELEEISKGQNYFPKNPSFRLGRVRALAALGRIQEVLKEIEDSTTTAQQTELPGAIMLVASQELRAHGYLNEAKEIAGRAVAWYQGRTPEQEASEKQRSVLALALYLNEQWENAQKLFQELAGEFPENIEYQGFLGRLAARLGDRKGALKISEELSGIERPFLFGSHTYSRACISSLLGEQEQAVELLREAFSHGRPYGVYLHRDLDLEPLREFPQFQQLLWPNR